MIPILLIIASFVAMEFFTGWFHRYVMHGLLWSVHESHHRPPRSFWQRNDLFVLFFTTTSMTLIFLGIPNGPTLWMGIGVAMYGMCYFYVHDFLIHKRLGKPPAPKSRYLRAIHRAHLAHHRHLDARPGEAFGLLWVPLRYWPE